MSDPYSSTSDADVARLRLEAERHRWLLREPIEEYWHRIAQRAADLGLEPGSLLIDQAERFIADLLIDPDHHVDLDLEAYRAVRDGVPVRYDAPNHLFVARIAGREVHIRPNGPERRLGIIARLAASGVDLDQILTVAAVVVTHPGRPGGAGVRVARVSAE
ncbi:hypothetical protein [Nocardia pseudobrasiliensis]|uniref:Uncharacterized protein n=1 Tax=Nocardia pseudobrasiliensis TaxID=45979 RepID=A0A370HWQ9_9NOCA|nr:hypothetical protein [Nocardia pseudobrasiliensis]RDI62919.1 hypothetical protein DFR76_112238 [Nocardia pseudobrasiliensis]